MKKKSFLPSESKRNKFSKKCVFLKLFFSLLAQKICTSKNVENKFKNFANHKRDPIEAHFLTHL